MRIGFISGGKNCSVLDRRCFVVATVARRWSEEEGDAQEGQRDARRK